MLRNTRTIANRTRRALKGGMPGTNSCQGLTASGSPCKSKCVGQFCATHKKVYERDNPSEDKRLKVTGTPNEKAMLAIMNKMNENIDVVNLAFVMMFVSREIFPPVENVNKFVTGGVAEEVVVDLFDKLGFKTTNVAATKNVIDVEVEVDGTIVGISLKNSGGINQQPILENYRGEKRNEIRNLPPTLIVYTENPPARRARIVYLDHDILKQAYPGLSDEAFNAAVYKQADSNLTFKSGLLKTLIPRLPKEYIVNAKFPDAIPKVAKKSITRLALDYVMEQMKHTAETVAPSVVIEDAE